MIARDMVRGWCEAASLPFSVTGRPPAKAPVWFTVEWLVGAVAPIGYSGLVKETGELRVIVAGGPRRGAAVVEQAARAIVAELLARKDPEAQFVFLHVGRPGGSLAGHRLVVPLAYQLHRDESEIAISTTNVVATPRQAGPDRRERPTREPTEKEARERFRAAQAANPRTTFAMWAGDKPFNLARSTVYRYWRGKSWSRSKPRPHKP